MARPLTLWLQQRSTGRPARLGIGGGYALRQGGSISIHVICISQLGKAGGGGGAGAAVARAVRSRLAAAVALGDSDEATLLGDGSTALLRHVLGRAAAARSNRTAAATAADGSTAPAASAPPLLATAATGRGATSWGVRLLGSALQRGNTAGRGLLHSRRDHRALLGMRGRGNGAADAIHHPLRPRAATAATGRRSLGQAACRRVGQAGEGTHGNGVGRAPRRGQDDLRGKESVRGDSEDGTVRVLKASGSLNGAVVLHNPPPRSLQAEREAGEAEASRQAQQHHVPHTLSSAGGGVIKHGSQTVPWLAQLHAPPHTTNEALLNLVPEEAINIQAHPNNVGAPDARGRVADVGAAGGAGATSAGLHQLVRPNSHSLPKRNNRRIRGITSGNARAKPDPLTVRVSRVRPLLRLKGQAQRGSRGPGRGRRARGASRHPGRARRARRHGCRR